MYDFTAAIQAATAAIEGSNTGETKKYPYPLVYPQPGTTLVFRPLFNPASGQILRLINRHEKVACYRTYNTECPICKIQKSVSAMLGTDPFSKKKGSKTRGLCFAQFISSTLPIRKGSDANSPVIQPGDFILFMFPWSVYQQINAIIQAIGQTPTGMEQAFCHADSGCYLQVSVSNDGKFTYTTTQVPYMTFPTGMSDEDFTAKLDSMESLMEQVLPSTITEEIAKQVTEYEQEIYKQYIAPRTPTVGVPEGTAPVSIDQVIPNTTVPTAEHLPCFGKHQDNSPQCICCPDEALCEEQKLPF